MKKYNKIVGLLTFLIILSSCETVDFGSTNDNVNGPKDVNTAAMLSGAQRRFATNYGRAYRNIPSLYAQYQAQPSYQDESRYGLTAYSWNSYYVQTLENLQVVINKANDSEFSATSAFTSVGSKNNQIGVARIMKVLIFKRVTDVYGDIPYTEALLGSENLTPVYTPQEEIYKDFVKELQEARDMLNSNETGPTGDLIYGGDVTKWKKFANSLLLSVAIQMSKRFSQSGEFAATTFNEALSNSNGVIESVSDEAWFKYIDATSLVNPWSQNRGADYNLSEFFVGALKGDTSDAYSGDTEDMRLSVFSDDTSLPGLPYGLASYADVSGDFASISSNIAGAASPLSWMTSAYTYLNRAEAAELGWTSEDKNKMLEDGIRASYSSLAAKYGVDLSSYEDDFVAARLSEVSTAAGGFKQVLGEEKWVSLFTDVFQGWAEWRRTGYPVLTPSPAPLNDGDIPRRYLYPTSEQNLNKTNYDTGVSALTPAKDNNTSRFWWDKN